MIEIIREDDGIIRGVIEYYIVDINGVLDDKGEYAWVLECEIAPQYRGNGCLKKLMTKIVIRYPQLKFGYFKRNKYDDRIRLYSRNQLLNRR
jgi:hypothetical protein